MKTFQEFLTEAMEKNNGQVILKARPYQKSPTEQGVTFYAHVADVDSTTVDFTVEGNTLTPCVNENGDVVVPA